MKFLLLLFLCGCAAVTGSLPRWNGDPANCDYVLKKTCFKSTSIDKPDRRIVEDAFFVAEQFWGPNILDGWIVVFEPAIHCQTSRIGCTYPDTMQISILQSGECSPAILLHEAGHPKIGDPNHTSVLWHQADNLAAEFYHACTHNETP